MKKKIICTICLCLILTVLFGCSTETDTAVIDSDDYIFESDYQYFINSTSVLARSDNGYYYFKDALLTFFDTDKKLETVVCDQANCEHNDSSCSAFFDNNYRKTVLVYYDGTLLTDYVETKKNVLTHYVYEISLDGKSRKKKCMLYKSTGSSSARFCVHRGYVYLVRELASEEEGKSDYKIYKTPLDSKDEDLQEIFSYAGYDSALTNFEIYGNHLYFAFSSYEDAEGNGYNSVVYDYDIIQDQFSTVDLNNYEYGFIVNGRNIIYYDTKEKHYTIYDMDKRETVNTIEISDVGYISFDSENYYIDTSQAVNIGLSDYRTIYAVDTGGNIIKNIDIDNDYTCDFGYKDFLLFDGYQDYSTYKLFYDKEQNSSDETDFISMA